MGTLRSGYTAVKRQYEEGLRIGGDVMRRLHGGYTAVTRRFEDSSRIGGAHIGDAPG